MYQNLTEYQQQFMNGFLGGSVAALIATFILLFFLIMLAVYIYFALAWQAIATKRGYKRTWLAWVPIANIAMWLQLGGFHWAWIFLILIPIVGWFALFVMFVISNWRVFGKMRYPGWWALAPILGLIWGGLGTIAYGVVVGIVAWKRKR